MSAADDRDYWKRRERESLLAAENAPDAHVARIHRNFALNYRAAVERIDATATGG